MSGPSKRMSYGVADTSKCRVWGIGWLSFGRTEVVVDEVTYRTLYVRLGPAWGSLQLSIIRSD